MDPSRCHGLIVKGLQPGSLFPVDDRDGVAPHIDDPHCPEPRVRAGS